MQFKQSILIVAFSFAAYFISFFVNILIARMLGASNYGLYSSAIAFLLILSSISRFGLAKSALKFIPKYQNKMHLKVFFCFGFFTIFTLGVIVTLIAEGVLWLINVYINPSITLHPIIKVTWFVIPSALAFFCYYVLMAREKLLKSLIHYLIQIPLSFLIVLLIFYKRNILTTHDMVIIYGLTIVLGLLFLLFHLFRDQVIGTPKHLCPRDFFVWANSAKLFWLSSVLALFNQQGILILFDALTNNKQEVGIFAAYIQIASFLYLIFLSINSIATKKLTVLDIHSIEFQTESRRYLKIITLLTCIFSTLIFVFHYQILLWFGKVFVEDLPSLIIFLIGYIVSILLGLSTTILQLVKCAKKVVYQTLILFILMVICAVILIPYFQIVGAALSYTIPTIGVFIFRAIVTKKETKINLFYLGFKR